jgi:hypothetical protein
MPIKIVKVMGTDEDAPLIDAEGNETMYEGDMGITPQEMKKIMDAMPKTMNPAGMMSLFINLMCVYDFLPKSNLMMVKMLMVLGEMREEMPDLFEPGGAKRVAEKAEETIQKKFN